MKVMGKYRIIDLVIILSIFWPSQIFAQVCSPVGGMCYRTTDCCPGGCCEAHRCESRGFACSGDMPREPGGGPGCSTHFCPRGSICYLREICDYLNPCDRQPACKHVPLPPYNFTRDYSGASTNFLHSWTKFAHFGILASLSFLLI